MYSSSFWSKQLNNITAASIMGEFGKKMNMPKSFVTETDPRSPTLEGTLKVVSQQDQNILTESQGLPYETNFNKAVPLSIEESGMGSHDLLPLSIEESGMGSHDQLSLFVEESEMASHDQLPLPIEESEMGSHDQLPLSVEESGKM